jgi:hypothetical protein
VSNCKDAKGNTIEVGHIVTIVPRTDMLWFAKVVEVSDGGMALVIDKNNEGVTPAKVRVILDITLQGNPHLPLFPVICRIVTPQSEDMVNKLTEDSSQNPPSNGPITLQ